MIHNILFQCLQQIATCVRVMCPDEDEKPEGISSCTAGVHHSDFLYTTVFHLDAILAFYRIPYKLELCSVFIWR